MLPLNRTVNIREYVSSEGNSPFREWFERLSPETARRVTVAIYRLGLGNFSNVKGVGAGVFEYRVNFGPGYRIYFGKEGEQIVILLCGGAKKRQQKDIAIAQGRWSDYKQRKRSETWL